MIFQAYPYAIIVYHHSMPITTRATSEVPDGPRSHFTVKLRMSVWRDPTVEAPVASPWPQSCFVSTTPKLSWMKRKRTKPNHRKFVQKTKFVVFFSAQRILKLSSYQVVHNEESSHIITSVEHTAPTAPPPFCFPTNLHKSPCQSWGLIHLICFELTFKLYLYYFILIYMAVYDDSQWYEFQLCWHLSHPGSISAWSHRIRNSKGPNPMCPQLQRLQPNLAANTRLFRRQLHQSTNFHSRKTNSN